LSDDVEIWVYGSRARGDFDGLSDTDVLVVAEPGSIVDDMVASLRYPRVSVSRYSWSEMDAMSVYGSLYLHHLKLEGMRVRPAPRDPEYLVTLLAHVPPFGRAEEDLVGFRQAIDEAATSLFSGGWPDLECEIVATVARHAAILGAYCAGRPTFGRELPFAVAGAALGYGNEAIERLVTPATAWRKHLDRCSDSNDAIVDWIVRVNKFLEDLQPLIDGYRALLPVPA
jgi:predicted nucleotidyltransferase